MPEDFLSGEYLPSDPNIIPEFCSSLELIREKLNDIKDFRTPPTYFSRAFDPQKESIKTLVGLEIPQEGFNGEDVSLQLDMTEGLDPEEEYKIELKRTLYQIGITTQSDSMVVHQKDNLISFTRNSSTRTDSTSSKYPRTYKIDVGSEELFQGPVETLNDDLICFIGSCIELSEDISWIILLCQLKLFPPTKEQMDEVKDGIIEILEDFKSELQRQRRNALGDQADAEANARMN